MLKYNIMKSDLGVDDFINKCGKIFNNFKTQD